MNWFLKLLLFVVAFIIIDQLSNIIFEKLNDKAFEKNELSYDMGVRYCVEEATPDIAIIGSSTCNHHYIPKQIKDSLGLSVYNFGRDGSYLYYQNVLINLILDRYSPKVIIWEIGESCLSISHDKKSEYQNIKEFYQWYSRQYVKDIVDAKDNYQWVRMLSHGYRNNSDLYKYIRLCYKNDNQFDLGYVPLPTNSFVWGNDIKVEDGTDPQKLELLKATLQRAKNNNVLLIMTSSPRLFDDEIKEKKCYQDLRKLADDYQIDFLDYYNVSPFINDTTLFKDRVHLNHEGTEKYMEVFIPELKMVLKKLNDM